MSSRSFEKRQFDDVTYKAKHRVGFPDLDELYEQAIKTLKGYGFKDEQIQDEYEFGKFRIDLVGIRDDFKIAVEVGDCDTEKLFALKQHFDKVVWLCYWTKITKKVDSDEYIELKNKLNWTESRLNELEKRERIRQEKLIPCLERVDEILRNTKELMKDIKDES